MKKRKQNPWKNCLYNKKSIVFFLNRFRIPYLYSEFYYTFIFIYTSFGFIFQRDPLILQ